MADHDFIDAKDKAEAEWMSDHDFTDAIDKAEEKTRTEAKARELIKEKEAVAVVPEIEKQEAVVVPEIAK